MFIVPKTSLCLMTVLLWRGIQNRNGSKEKQQNSVLEGAMLTFSTLVLGQTQSILKDELLVPALFFFQSVSASGYFSMPPNLQVTE